MQPRMSEEELGFEWEKERAVDDFVFLCMLVRHGLRKAILIQRRDTVSAHHFAVCALAISSPLLLQGVHDKMAHLIGILAGKLSRL